MAHLLDNIFWNTLTGPHAVFAAGSGDVRRYARGFSPILGFRDPQRPDFAELERICDVGEHFYCDQWTGHAPAGWAIEAESTMYRMVYAGDLPPDGPGDDATQLSLEHAEQAVALAALTRPGPFGLRTIELGDYYGYFDGGQLVAMAGERTVVKGYREISGVCTHPDYQGRGYARALMQRLMRQQLLRGETPFLHVMSANAPAHTLYLRMGFTDHSEPVVRVIGRTDPRAATAS
ncbi:GNAT family N-acetyltransferase [Zemynaea arenosa]|uniref:GNAT family N-acetyltransferase n=1 Tax=Zemynaea arenosa TaxID=2561931 RepID=UPI001E55898B|nr:GNAT family N-acetyltransferase [Massilia arenosa]